MITNGPESVLENKTHKILWDFETQTDYQILTRKPSSGFYHSCRQESENKIKKRNNRQILGACQRADKAVEHEYNSVTNSSWCSYISPQRPGKETGETEDQRKKESKPPRPQHC